MKNTDKTNMNELVQLVAEKTGLSRNVVDNFLKRLFAIVEDGLRKDGAVKINSFGTFRLQWNEPRKSVDVNTGEETELACDGVFISVGRKPATELVKGQLELDKNGYIAADETTKTSLPGVYAVGDVRTKALRQVVTAVADGAAAVHMAEEYLAGGE